MGVEFNGFETIKNIPIGDNRRKQTFTIGIRYGGITLNEIIAYFECDQCMAARTPYSVYTKFIRHETDNAEIQVWFESMAEIHKKDCPYLRR